MTRSITRAIVVAFHKYTLFGGEYYEPLLSFFLQNLKKYEKEFDRVYLVDSTWNISPASHHLPKNAVVMKVDPHLRYYDAYKKVLPDIQEDTVLFMDDDMVVYREGKIGNAFAILESGNADVISIYDTIGTMKVELPNGKNKFCPYWFAAYKSKLMKYLDVDWSPDAMPYTETFGLLTEAMLKDKLKSYEFEEDKGSYLFSDTSKGEKGKDLGYYHIRSGSTPAYLLATREHGNKQVYLDYINHQPRNEYLRQCAWYTHMGGSVCPILEDLDISETEWLEYMIRFKDYHGL